MVAVAAHPAHSDAWAEEWFGAEDEAESGPWLFDVAGNPVHLPAEVIGFRARWLPPTSRGIGELVLDDSKGFVLFVPRGAGPEEFAALVGYRPGRYKLAAIDARYQFLREVPIAHFVVTPAMAAAHRAAQSSADPPPAAANAVAAPSPHGESLVLELVHLLKSSLTEPRTDPVLSELLGLLRLALSEHRTALTDALGVVKAQATESARHVSELVRASATVVTAADGAGISRRDPLPVPPVTVAVEPPAAPPANDDGGGSPQNLGEVVTGALHNLAPMLQHIMNTKVFKMSDETSFAMLRAMSGMGGGPANASNAVADSPAPASAPASAAPASPPPAAASAAPPASGAAPAASAAPASSVPSAAPAFNPAVLWPHLASVEQLLTPGEAAVVRRYLSAAASDQVEHLAREVMARSAPDAAAWIRSVLSDVEGSEAAAMQTVPEF